MKQNNLKQWNNFAWFLQCFWYFPRISLAFNLLFALHHDSQVFLTEWTNLNYVKERQKSGINKSKWDRTASPGTTLLLQLLTLSFWMMSASSFSKILSSSYLLHPPLYILLYVVFIHLLFCQGVKDGCDGFENKLEGGDEAGSNYMPVQYRSDKKNPLITGYSQALLWYHQDQPKCLLVFFFYIA